jgi:hypothetical protein
MFQPQAKGARREQRDSDHVPEDGPILVPADGSSWAIFCEQHVPKVGCRDFREIGGEVPDGQQELRHVLRLLEPAAAEVVAPAKGHDATLAQEAVKLELSERAAL